MLHVGLNNLRFKVLTTKHEVEGAYILRPEVVRRLCGWKIYLELGKYDMWFRADG